MATFGQITYMVLDMLKELHDDAYYTEEHIIFLASKMRALLLERKYKNNRNTSFQQMSDENIQEICLDLEPTEILPAGCSGLWLKSVQEIPSTMSISEPKVYLAGDMIQSVVNFIPVERMPYVGHNKWLRHIVYAAKSQDGHLYLNGRNPQFMYLQKAKMSGLFSDPQKAAELSCENSEASGCDILQMEFPLEQALVPSCIEMVVQGLIGSRYAPEDKDNNAKDDFGSLNVTQQRQAKPAENTRQRDE